VVEQPLQLALTANNTASWELSARARFAFLT